jgi:hypothetical protein
MISGKKKRVNGSENALDAVSAGTLEEDHPERKKGVLAMIQSDDSKQRSTVQALNWIATL